MTTLTSQTIVVDEDIATALEGEILRPDSVALAQVMRHAVLVISHELGDISEGPHDIDPDELRPLATRLQRVAAALEVMDVHDGVRRRKGGQ